MTDPKSGGVTLEIIAIVVAIGSAILSYIAYDASEKTSQQQKKFACISEVERWRSEFTTSYRRFLVDLSLWANEPTDRVAFNTAQHTWIDFEGFFEGKITSTEKLLCQKSIKEEFRGFLQNAAKVRQAIGSGKENPPRLDPIKDDIIKIRKLDLAARCCG